MKSKLRSAGLIALGAIAGILVSLNFQAIADRSARLPLPVEELRAFSDVFDAIKRNYVEPVDASAGSASRSAWKRASSR